MKQIALILFVTFLFSCSEDPASLEQINLNGKSFIEVTQNDTIWTEFHDSIFAQVSTSGLSMIGDFLLEKIESNYYLSLIDDPFKSTYLIKDWDDSSVVLSEIGVLHTKDTYWKASSINYEKLKGSWISFQSVPPRPPLGQKESEIMKQLLEENKSLPFELFFDDNQVLFDHFGLIDSAKYERPFILISKQSNLSSLFLGHGHVNKEYGKIIHIKTLNDSILEIQHIVCFENFHSTNQDYVENRIRKDFFKRKTVANTQ